jgi:two-component system, LytTR family, sensor kinase
MILKNRTFRWFLFLLIWLLIGLAFATQLRMFMIKLNRHASWYDVMSWEVTRWGLWAVLSPLILWLTRRFPISSERKLQRFGIHLLAGSLISFLHLVLFSILFWLQAKVVLAFSLKKPFLETVLVQIPEILKKSGEDPFLVFKSIFTLDFHVGILVYWGIVMSYLAIESSRRASRLETQLAQAQLEALKMQLHPHFLFNTLNSISALLHQDPEAADEMIGELGDFLRLTLGNPGAQEVTLQEELKFLKSYLEIERVRLQNRLTALFEVEEDILNAQVPNLILQPIIENAIRYAVSPKIGPGRIEIRARRRNGRLEMEVIDDGPGMIQGSSAKQGIGLSNTRQRLQQMYGSNHDFRLRNLPEGGFEVHLEIPYRTMEQTTLEVTEGLT